MGEMNASREPIEAMADFLDTDDSIIQRVLKDIEILDVVMAMKATTPTIRQRFLDNISESAAARVTRMMAGTIPDANDSRRAQRLLMNAANQIIAVGPEQPPVPSICYEDMNLPVTTLPLAQLPAFMRQLAELAKRDGLLSLEALLDEFGDRFLGEGVRLIVEGTDPTEVEAVLNLRRDQADPRHPIFQAGVLAIQDAQQPEDVEAKCREAML